MSNDPNVILDLLTADINTLAKAAGGDIIKPFVNKVLDKVETIRTIYFYQRDEITILSTALSDTKVESKPDTDTLTKSFDKVSQDNFNMKHQIIELEKTIAKMTKDREQELDDERIRIKKYNVNANKREAEVKRLHQIIEDLNKQISESTK